MEADFEDMKKFCRDYCRKNELQQNKYMVDQVEEQITEENFDDHLGQREYFKSYYKYFNSLVEEQHQYIDDILQKYLIKLCSGLGSLEFQPFLKLTYGLDIHDKNLIFNGLALLCSEYEPYEIEYQYDGTYDEDKTLNTGVLFRQIDEILEKKERYKQFSDINKLLEDKEYVNLMKEETLFNKYEQKKISFFMLRVYLQDYQNKINQQNVKIIDGLNFILPIFQTLPDRQLISHQILHHVISRYIVGGVTQPFKPEIYKEKDLTTEEELQKQQNVKQYLNFLDKAQDISWEQIMKKACGSLNCQGVQLTYTFYAENSQYGYYFDEHYKFAALQSLNILDI